jgi:sugar lactone lactonase YvrE
MCYRHRLSSAFEYLDSRAVEAAGNIRVATLMPGFISVIAPDGRLVRQISMPWIWSRRTSVPADPTSGRLAKSD